MKKNDYEILVEKITDRVMNRFMELVSVREGTGFDNIFTELKSEMENISILPDNKVDASKYEEKAIIDSLKKLGYEYKKALGNKLHFFNKETSVSLYMLQGKNVISLVP